MKRAPLVAVILAIGLIGAGIAVASTRDGIVEHQVLSFALVGFQENRLDVPPDGRSLGDSYFFRQQLWTLDLTKKVGVFYSNCVLENAKTGLNRCSGTAFLRDGKVEITTQALLKGTDKGIRFAVIGGTGSYDNVVGQAKVIFGGPGGPAGGNDILKLDLIPSFQQP